MRLIGEWTGTISLVECVAKGTGFGIILAKDNAYTTVIGPWLNSALLAWFKSSPKVTSMIDRDMPEAEKCPLYPQI